MCIYIYREREHPNAQSSSSTIVHCNQFQIMHRCSKLQHIVGGLKRAIGVQLILYLFDGKSDQFQGSWGWVVCVCVCLFVGNPDQGA